MASAKKRASKSGAGSRRRRTWHWAAFAGKWLLVAVIASVLLVLPFRWINPPGSMMMAIRRFEAIQQHRSNFQLDYRWRDFQQMAGHLPLAVLAAEDQKFPSHHGFDLGAIADAVEARLEGGRLRGASTISQQVAKNLYLWPGKNMLRKGLEAWLTVLIETFWHKQRILEIYLNIAEFGDGIFGAEAASRRYFHRSAVALTSWQAARLAAILPAPRTFNPRHPSDYVMRRARWIRQQMNQLGRVRMLNAIE